MFRGFVCVFESGINKGEYYEGRYGSHGDGIRTTDDVRKAKFLESEVDKIGGYKVKCIPAEKDFTGRITCNGLFHANKPWDITEKAGAFIPTFKNGRRLW